MNIRQKFIRIFTSISIIVFPLAVFSQTEDFPDVTKEQLLSFIDTNQKMDNSKFINFAIKLFINGNKVDFEKLKTIKTNLVGVGVDYKRENDSIASIPKIYGLSYLYKDYNFHKNLYTGGYGDFFAHFFVIAKSLKQEKMIEEAKAALLLMDSIPKLNQAFRYARAREFGGGEYYKLYKTNDSSFTCTGTPKFYFRQFGNYLIQIDVQQEYGVSNLNSKIPKDRKMSLNFVCMYIIDENLKKAFNKLDTEFK